MGNRDTFEIRNFVASDAAKVKSVALAAWRFTYKEIYSDDYVVNIVNRYYDLENLKGLGTKVAEGKIYFAVAELDSDVAGFCHIGKSKLGAELFRIYITPEYVREGIGTRLLESGEVFLKQKKYKKYFCFVHRKNEIGKGFYIKNGFQHQPNQDEDDDWYMEKIL